VAGARTDTAQFIVDGALRLAGQAGPMVMLAALYPITAVLTEFMSNNATAVLLAPVAELMARYPDRRLAATYAPDLRVRVGPELARFGAWYELFPRSLGKDGRHGTFKDVEDHLPRLADLGFDVLYFPAGFPAIGTVAPPSFVGPAGCPANPCPA